MHGALRRGDIPYLGVQSNAGKRSGEFRKQNGEHCDADAKRARVSGSSTIQAEHLRAEERAQNPTLSEIACLDRKRSQALPEWRSVFSTKWFRRACNVLSRFVSQTSSLFRESSARGQ